MKKYRGKGIYSKYCQMPNKNHSSGICARHVRTGHVMCDICEWEMMIDSIELEIYDRFVNEGKGKTSK